MSTFRYPGSKPFETDQQHIFFGRKKNIDELYRRISLEPFTILCSKSGLGKSSLINAGLLPRIKKKNKFTPIYIRFLPTESEAQSPAMKTGLKIRAGKKNVETFLDKLITDEHTFWHDLKEQQIISQDGKGILLIFDQFEEFFTYSPEEQLDFRKQLSEALNIAIPQRYWDIMELYDKDSLPFGKEELALLQKDMELRVLFSIREDRLHLLDNISDYLPTSSVNWYKLGALDRTSALEAIIQPAKIETAEFDSATFSYTDDAIKHILDFLTKDGEKQIESSQLQIICNSIEHKVINKNLSEITRDEIDNLNEIIKNYYDARLNGIEDPVQRQKARDLIEDELIFSDGTEKRRLALFEGKVLQSISQETLSILVNSHLLRSEAVEDGGFTYELSHDALLEPILEARTKKEESKKEAELKQAKKMIRAQRTRIARTTLVAVLAIIGLFYGFLQKTIAEDALVTQNEALQQTREIKISSLLNNAQLKLKDNPTLSFRLAEAVKAKHGNNINLRKTFVDIYNNVYFYNSFPKSSSEINSIELNASEDKVIAGYEDGSAVIWNINGEALDTLRGHSGNINHAVISKSGKYAVTASNDRTAILWSLSGLNKIYTYPHDNEVNSVAISNDDQLVITTGDDAKTYFWNTNGELLNFYKSKGEVSWTTFNNEGNRIFNYSLGNFIRQWEKSGIKTPNPKSITYQTIGGYTPLPFSRSPENNFTVSIKSKHKVQIHTDGKSAYTSQTVSFNNLSLKTVAISEDKKWLAVSDADNNITLRNLEDRTNKIIGQHNGLVYKLLFSADGQYLVSVSEDHSVKIWDTYGTLQQTIENLYGHNIFVNFLNKQKSLLVASDHEIRIYPLRAKEAKIIVKHEKPVNSAHFSADNKLVLTASEDQTAKLYNLASAQIEEINHRAPVKNAYFFNSDQQRYSNLLLTLSGLKSTIWDYATDEIVEKKVFDQHEKMVNKADIVGNGSHIMDCNNNMVYEWTSFDRKNKNKDTSYQRINIQHPDVFKISDIKYVPPEYTKMAFALESISFKALYILPKLPADTITNLFDLETRTDVLKLYGHKDEIIAFKFSDDGEKLVSVSKDNLAIIWDKSGNRLATLRGHNDDVLDADFSSDGNYLVTCSRDKTIKIWDVSGVEANSFYELFSYQEHAAAVNSVEFSADNYSVLSASDDGTVRLKSVILDVDEIIKTVNDEKTFGAGKKIKRSRKK